MKDADFARVLTYGQIGERQVGTLFEYDEIEYMNGKNSDFDVSIKNNGDKITFEAKRDSYIDRTNNFAIEYASNNILSGISLTKADYYIYMNDDMSDVWLIPVIIIKKAIKQVKYHSKIRCGYNKLSQCYLFDKSIFDMYRINQEEVDADETA